MTFHQALGLHLAPYMFPPFRTFPAPAEGHSVGSVNSVLLTTSTTCRIFLSCEWTICFFLASINIGTRVSNLA